MKIIKPDINKLYFTDDRNDFKQILIKYLLSIFLSLIPSALAFAAGGDTPVSQGISYITTAMYGTTGLALSTVAIMAVGLLCVGHYLEWKRLLQTVIGVGIIFGAGGVAKTLQSLITQ